MKTATYAQPTSMMSGYERYDTSSCVYGGRTAEHREEQKQEQPKRLSFEEIKRQYVVGQTREGRIEGHSADHGGVSSSVAVTDVYVMTLWTDVIDRMRKRRGWNVSYVPKSLLRMTNGRVVRTLMSYVLHVVLPARRIEN